VVLLFILPVDTRIH